MTCRILIIVFIYIYKVGEPNIDFNHLNRSKIHMKQPTYMYCVDSTQCDWATHSDVKIGVNPPNQYFVFLINALFFFSLPLLQGNRLSFSLFQYVKPLLFHQIFSRQLNK